MNKVSDGLPNYSGLARYYDIDEDNASSDIVLIMEYIRMMSLKTHIESYGLFEIDTVKSIIFNILVILKDLQSIDCYHGRLNINNIHVDELWRVKLTDYYYMSILDSESSFTTEEGIRLDIFWIGIWILKMIGKLRVDEGGSSNNEAYYLEHMETIKKTYRSVSSSTFILTDLI